MKKAFLLLLLIGVAGCNSTAINRKTTATDGTIQETSFRHSRLPWGERTLDGLEIEGLSDGSYSASLKGYQGEDTQGWQMANEAMRNSVSVALEAIKAAKSPAVTTPPPASDELTVDSL